MNKAAMERMSAKELDEYGAILGIEMRPAKTEAEKIALICTRRERTATVCALGMQFEVRMKSLSDKRVTEILQANERTDEDVLTVLDLMLGEEQFAQLMEAVTDEDDTIDVNALAYAFVQIVTSDELKN